jgi:hypothetical protein
MPRCWIGFFYDNLRTQFPPVLRQRNSKPLWNENRCTISVGVSDIDPTSALAVEKSANLGEDVCELFNVSLG